MNEKEQWKWIEGFEGLYRVSNFGRVYSEKTKKFLSQNRVTKDGYIHVALRKNGKVYERRVNRLVAEAFLPNPENKPTVNHKDGNKLNNHVDNLEWATKEENMQHAYKLGLKKPIRGCDHRSSKLTKEQISEIKKTYKRYKKGFGSVALAKKYGVDSSTILRIVQGKRHA